MFATALLEASSMLTKYGSSPYTAFIDPSARTQSGVSVNTDNAARFSAVYACWAVLSQGLATLPIHVYRRLPNGGKERATDHPLYTVLHDEPNEFQSAFMFKEAGMVNLCAGGNTYAEILRDGAGNTRGLWPIRPDRVNPIVDGNVFYYEITILNGTVRRYPADRILHVANLGDGFVGWSPVKLHREAIALGIAAEKSGASFFGNGARPSLVLKHPGQLADDKKKRLIESWKGAYAGPDNVGKTALLEHGIEVTPIHINQEDAQYIDQRKFQITEIARIYRVPPHMIADLERSTNNNIEHQSLEFLKFTMLHWIVRWQQEINRKLFTPAERQTLFAEFMIDYTLLADLMARQQAYASAAQNGWMNRNEIRELENKNPYDGGEEYTVQSNLVPVNRLNDLVDKQQATPPTPEGRPGRPDEGAITEAFTEVLADAYGRLLRRTQKALNGKKTIEKVCEEIADDVRMALIPGVEGFNKAVGGTIQAEVLASATVDASERHIRRTRNEFGRLGPAVFETWNTTRPRDEARETLEKIRCLIPS